MAQLKETRSKDKQKRPTAKRTRCPRDRRRFVFYLCTQTQFLTRGKISPRRRCNCCNLFLSGPSVSFCIMNENRRGPTVLLKFSVVHSVTLLAAGLMRVYIACLVPQRGRSPPLLHYRALWRASRWVLKNGEKRSLSGPFFASHQHIWIDRQRCWGGCCTSLWCVNPVSSVFWISGVSRDLYCGVGVLIWPWGISAFLCPFCGISVLKNRA